jgi:hypothetical protein
MSGIYFDVNLQTLFSTGDVKEKKRHASLIYKTWNISANTQYSPLCGVTIPSAIFMPIAFDEVAYQTEGSNYYVTHTDILIPLWNILKKHQKTHPGSPLPEIFLFAFNVEGKIDLLSPAFDDYNKYWIQSLQLLLGDAALQMGTLEGLSRYLSQAGAEDTYGHGYNYASQRKEESERGACCLCFEEVLFGVPQFNPTRRAVRSFVNDYRMVCIDATHHMLGFHADAAMCSF